MAGDNLVFLENLEWFDETGRELVHRLPEKGSGEIKWGAQLTIRESQAGVFFYKGKAIEAFGVGTMSHFSHFYPDGGNIYVIFVGHASSPEEVETKYQQIWDAGLEAAHRAGGTLSHQHGVGLLKAPWMSIEHGETGFALLQAIKQYLDPNNIMNPGKLGLGNETSKFPKEGDSQ